MLEISRIKRFICQSKPPIFVHEMKCSTYLNVYVFRNTTQRLVQTTLVLQTVTTAPPFMEVINVLHQQDGSLNVTVTCMTPKNLFTPLHDRLQTPQNLNFWIQSTTRFGYHIGATIKMVVRVAQKTMVRWGLPDSVVFYMAWTHLSLLFGLVWPSSAVAILLPGLHRKEFLQPLFATAKVAGLLNSPSGQCHWLMLQCSCTWYRGQGFSLSRAIISVVSNLSAPGFTTFPRDLWVGRAL